MVVTGSFCHCDDNRDSTAEKLVNSNRDLCLDFTPSSGLHILEMAVAPHNQLFQHPTTSPSAALLLGAITIARY